MHEIKDKMVSLAVARLAVLRFNRKAIEKEEKELKPFVRAYMESNGLKRAKTFTGARVHLDPNTRTFLDEGLLCEVLKVKDLQAFRGKRTVTSKLTCHEPKGRGAK